MKFTLITAFVFFALGSAELTKVRRQTAPSVEDAAMSDGSGNPVSFNTAGVNMAMKNSGQ
ncbi:hypothetical protein PG996_015382 [Apiospora saccharicola]|uniref:Uncharacterized protein n=1 Tax=Apiospora saccharicola TaxID=335842 RepID=A0ABR1TL24_9PEZI